MSDAREKWSSIIFLSQFFKWIWMCMLGLSVLWKRCLHWTYLSCHYGMPQQHQFGGAFRCPLPALTKSSACDMQRTRTAAQNTQFTKYLRTLKQFRWRPKFQWPVALCHYEFSQPLKYPDMVARISDAAHFSHTNSVQLYTENSHTAFREPPPTYRNATLLPSD